MKAPYRNTGKDSFPPKCLRRISKSQYARPSRGEFLKLQDFVMCSCVWILCLPVLLSAFGKCSFFLLFHCKVCFAPVGGCFFEVAGIQDFIILCLAWTVFVSFVPLKKKSVLCLLACLRKMSLAHLPILRTVVLVSQFFSPRCSVCVCFLAVFVSHSLFHFLCCHFSFSVPVFFFLLSFSRLYPKLQMLHCLFWL